jgi:hypothetical protein
LKGYFQKLATQTGLNVSSGGISSPAEPVTPSPTGSSVAAPAGPAPFAVETVSFTAQPTEPGGENIGSDSVASSHGDRSVFSPSADSVGDGPNRGGDAESEDRSSSREPIVEIRPVTLVSESRTSWDRSESQHGDSESGDYATRETGQTLRTEGIESDVTSLRGPSENQIVPGLSNRDAPQRPALSSDRDAIDETIVWAEKGSERTKLSEQLESSDEAQGLRNEEVGGYLKEVMEWISARPDTDDEDRSAQISDAFAEGAAGATDAAEAKYRGLQLINESRAAAQVEQTRDPDIQNTTLSIGTISIVVEDPSGQTPLPAPIQTQSASPSAAATEPTNLSRYYLRSW